MAIANLNLTLTGDMLVLPSDPRWAAWPAWATLPMTSQTALILDASQMVENFCRHPFQTAQGVIENFDGTNLNRLWLSIRPVIAVMSVIVNQVPLDNTYNDAWTFNPATGEITRGDGMDSKSFEPWFPEGTQNIQVNYIGGPGTVPGPVMRATVICARYLHEQTGLSQVYASRSLGDYSYSINNEVTDMTMPPPAAALLAPYVSNDISFV
jgi:hypothetical protein